MSQQKIQTQNSSMLSKQGRVFKTSTPAEGVDKSSSQVTSNSFYSAHSSTLSSFDTPDLICLSHLRWNFVFQRPQHLLTRCAQSRRVFFIEEPIFQSDSPAHFEISNPLDQVWVVVPHLVEGCGEAEATTIQQQLLDELLVDYQIQQYICWYYTPMALSFTHHLKPLTVIYDCMDELSAFKGASPALKEREAHLFQRANLVFTGGQSLYEAKRDHHPMSMPFPAVWMCLTLPRLVPWLKSRLIRPIFHIRVWAFMASLTNAWIWICWLALLKPNPTGIW